MGVLERIGMHAARDETGEMRHVDHEKSADGIGDLAKAREIDEARIGRAARDDQFRLVGLRQRLDFVHVDAMVLAAHAVRNRLEPFARLVDRRAVRQMAARVEAEPHERVARLHQREEHRLIRLRAGMWLDIRERTVE